MHERSTSAGIGQEMESEESFGHLALQGLRGELDRVVEVGDGGKRRRRGGRSASTRRAPARAQRERRATHLHQKRSILCSHRLSGSLSTQVGQQNGLGKTQNKATESHIPFGKKSHQFWSDCGCLMCVAACVECTQYAKPARLSTGWREGGTDESIDHGCMCSDTCLCGTPTQTSSAGRQQQQQQQQQRANRILPFKASRLPSARFARASAAATGRFSLCPFVMHRYVGSADSAARAFQKPLP